MDECPFNLQKSAISSSAISNAIPVCQIQGALKDYKMPINIAVLRTILYQSSISKYGHREYQLGYMYLPLLAALTDQRWMYMYSMAFTASMWQGVAHRTTKEAPTLAQLGNDYSMNLYDFFPNLLLQVYTIQLLVDHLCHKCRIQHNNENMMLNINH